MKISNLLVRGAVALLSSAVFIPAQATIIYSFGQTAVGGFGAGPYGSVTLDDSSPGAIRVTVNLFNHFLFVDTGAHHAFGFNMNNPSAYTMALIAPAADFTLLPGSFTQPGFGGFNRGFDCTLCGNGASSPVPPPLIFSVTGSGLTVNSFVANSSGYLFSADVYGNGFTGAVAVRNTAVPEPAIITLLGLGLVGLGFVYRKKT